MLKIGIVNFIKKSPIEGEEEKYYNDFICEKTLSNKIFFLTNNYYWFNLCNPNSNLELFYIRDNEDNGLFFDKNRVILKTYLINILKKKWKKKFKEKKLRNYFSKPKNLFDYKLNIKKRKRIT